MKTRTLIAGFALGTVVTLVASQARTMAQDDPHDMERMMKLWQEMATPGAPHAHLAKGAGEWDVTTKMWMMGPGQPATETKGTATAEMIMGGRFLRMDFQGEMMGMPFTGLGITGYDNFKKKFVSFWIDSNGTAMHRSEGMLDQTGKVVTYYGTMDEWMTGEHDKPVKYVDRHVDENTAVFEIHDLGIQPGETKVIEMVYTRKGAESRPGR